MMFRVFVKLSLFTFLIVLTLLPLTEEAVHEYAACLFLLPIILHAGGEKWWLTVGRRRRDFLIRNWIVFFMVLSAVTVFITGFCISRYAVPFLRVSGVQSLLCSLHRTAGIWCFTLTAVHFGLHTCRIRNLIPAYRTGLLLLTAAVTAEGMNFLAHSRPLLPLIALSESLNGDLERLTVLIVLDWVGLFSVLVLLTKVISFLLLSRETPLRCFAALHY
jgi:hypothetical protein